MRLFACDHRQRCLCLFCGRGFPRPERCEVVARAIDTWGPKHRLDFEEAGGGSAEVAEGLSGRGEHLGSTGPRTQRGFDELRRGVVLACWRLPTDCRHAPFYLTPGLAPLVPGSGWTSRRHDPMGQKHGPESQSGRASPGLRTRRKKIRATWSYSLAKCLISAKPNSVSQPFHRED